MTRTTQKIRRTPKRGAEDDHLDSPGSRRSKRRAAGTGQSSAPAGTSVALSQEELFKLRNAAEFDDCKTETRSKGVEVKDEPTDTPSGPANGTRSPATTADAATAALRDVRPSPAITAGRTVPGAAFTEANNRDSILDNLLSQTFNPEMTQYVVRQILQDAQGSASRGNEFGIAYIEAQIERLQRKGTPPSRLTEVIQLFQQGLRDLSNQFCSRISSVGVQVVQLEPSEPKDAPNVVGEHQSESPIRQQRGKIPEPRSARLQAGPVEVASISQKNLAAFKSTHSQSDSSTSSSEEEEDTPRKNISRYLDDDNEEYKVDGDDSLDSRSQCSGDTSILHCNDGNLKLYGTKQPRTGFDVYARCAISACMPAPGSENIASKIRQRAMLIWRPCSHREKAKWELLYQTRHTDPEIFKKGNELLKSQGLLAKLKLHSHAFNPHQQNGPQQPKPGAKILTKATPSASSQVASTSRVTTTTLPLFPFLTEATSLTPITQPCYVPFASRVDENPACLYIVNTPDTNTGAPTTEADVLAAFRKREFPGLISFSRCNSNVFTATFNTPSTALIARNSAALSLPSTVTPGSGSVSISAGFHFTWGPRVFFCDVATLEVDHDTVVPCVTKALRGRNESAHYELLQQETPEPYDDRMRYILRFKKGARAPWVQQFHIPIEVEQGGGKVWAIFRPENLHVGCQFCGATCQLGSRSSCRFTRIIAVRGGKH